MGYAIGHDRTIKYDEIPAGEIECCRSCTAFAATDHRLGMDFKFMQLRHADHQLSPELYVGWPTEDRS